MISNQFLIVSIEQEILREQPHPAQESSGVDLSIDKYYFISANIDCPLNQQSW